MVIRDKRIAPPKPITHADGSLSVVPRTVRDRDTNEVNPNPGKVRADFRDEEFTRILLQHGKFVTWRKALICTCLNEITSQSEINCTECDGSGFFYTSPVEIRAHMAAFDKDTKLFEKFGMWQEGGVSVTCQAKYRLGYRDSLELRDSVMSFAELLKKGNRRGIRGKLPASKDSGRYRIANMTKLLFRDKAKVTQSLVENEDFKIDENGWIEWTGIGNRRVPDNTVLSALYDFHPVFIVVSFPHVVRDDVSGRKVLGKSKAISLPIQAMAKLDFLVDVNTPAPTTGS